MDKITRITAEHRANLVAYLDGELDETTTREIEQTLSKSPVARNDIEMLARTWEMLDTLPRASASDGFTVRTLVSLKAADAPRSLSDQQWFKNARRGVILAGWVTALAGSVVVGFLITYRWIPYESQQLLEDLPVVENVDIYTEIGGIEFLTELQRSNLFFDDLP